MNYLGDLGGFFSILNLVGMMVAHKFSYFIYKSEIFSEIYQDQKSKKKETKSKQVP